MKVHFYHGCPWADGSIQQADTDQRYDWQDVNCQHCLANKQPDGSSRHWEQGDRERYEGVRESKRQAILNAVKTLRQTLFAYGYKYQGESLDRIEHNA